MLKVIKYILLIILMIIIGSISFIEYKKYKYNKNINSLCMFISDWDKQKNKQEEPFICNDFQIKELTSLIKKAEEKDIKSQIILGALYYESKDFKKALPLILAAYNNGEKGAAYTLGLMYQNGWGVKSDLSKAFYYYNSDSEMGYLEAKYNLGLMYLNGEGTLKNLKKSFNIFKELEEKMTKDFIYYHQVMYTLGLLYENGWGTNSDYSKAFYYYSISAKKGNGFAQYNLGHMYFKGSGIKKDYIKSYAWFSTSWSNGVSEAKKAITINRKIMAPVNLDKAIKLTNEYKSKYI